MTDVLERISWILPSLGNGDELDKTAASILQDARDEIERLRADVVITREMSKSFREIKQEIKNGPSV